MNKVNVKICGLKSANDVRMCMALEADMLGFVVDYPIPIPWNICENEAAKLISLVEKPCKSCVVTGGTSDKIISLMARLKPDFVQLHYKETLKDTVSIVSELTPLGIGVIKTMPITELDQLHQFGTTDMADIVTALCETDISAILLDARTPSNVNERGHMITPELFRNIQDISSKPVVLAGGITSSNVNKMLLQTGAIYIDVMTGIEHSPGVKDREKLEKLMSGVCVV